VGIGDFVFEDPLAEVSERGVVCACLHARVSACV